MTLKKTIICFGVIIVCLLATAISFGVSPEPSEVEKQEYKQDRERIETMKKSFNPGPTNDIKSFEKFADEIQRKWKAKDPEHYAKLMLEICGPISSGRFNTDNRANIAKKYALSALTDPNKITLETEIELIGHVMTPMITRFVPTGQEWTQQRREDIQVRLYDWKRLTDAIDPTWDPNNLPLLNVPLPSGVEGMTGMSPKDINDPALRAKYEADIERNRQKAERYGEQYRLRNWLKRFPPRAEEYIIQAYSKPPFDVEELKQYLDKYVSDTKTKVRILEAVTKNMEKETRKKPTTP
jgi:hypothetical protein